MEGLIADILWNCGVFLAGAFLGPQLWKILNALRGKVDKNIDNFGK